MKKELWNIWKQLRPLIIFTYWMNADDVEVKLASVIFSVRFNNKEEDSQYVVAAQGFLI